MLVLEAELVRQKKKTEKKVKILNMSEKKVRVLNISEREKKEF